MEQPRSGGGLQLRHGTRRSKTAGFTIENLAEIPGWEKIMLTPVPAPERMRSMGRFSMRQVLQWSARLHASVRGIQGDGATDVVKKLLATAIENAFAGARNASQDAMLAGCYAMVDDLGGRPRSTP